MQIQHSILDLQEKSEPLYPKKKGAVARYWMRCNSFTYSLDFLNAVNLPQPPVSPQASGLPQVSAVRRAS